MLSLLRRFTLAVTTLLWIPLLAVVAATILFFNLIHLLTRFTRKRPAEAEFRLSGLASIIVLNWNGRELLAEGLPSILEAVRADGRPHEIVVVDNGSQDGSVDFVRREFPSLRIVALSENLGFAEGNNAGVRAARHDVVILLNNDMVVDTGFLRPLLEGFGPRTFAVTSQIFLQDPAARREETGKTRAVFRRGMINYSHDDLSRRTLTRNYYPAFWAGGGSTAYRRDRFLRLGGFSDLFSPMYVEDTDLSYQAWKHGWEVLFAPSSIVYHRHRASSSRRFRPVELQGLILRNQLFFIWKNIRSWRLLLSHCLFLPCTCYRFARDHGVGVWRRILQAIWMLPSVLIARLESPFRASYRDQEIFELFKTPALYFYRRTLERRLERVTSPRHILWITAYLPHMGIHAGAGRMYQLLKRLSATYRVTLLTFLENEEEREFLSQLDGLCQRVVALRRMPPLRWQFFPYEPFEEFRTPEMEQALEELLEENDFDLIQLEYSQMACYAKQALRIPNLLTKHEVDFAACLRRMRLERSIRFRTRWFYNYLQVLDREIRLLRSVDAAICMTDVDAQQLRKYCKSVPIHVVNTGVDLEYFAPPKYRATEPRLVFVGAFQHQPNVDAMLYFCQSILPRIRQRIPETELWIIGSSPPPSVLDLGDGHAVHVTGFVEDIRPYIASSSVYVVPLRLGVGIRGKILEAWSMGMAVVATSVACAGLRCEPGTHLLLADDAELFASHVLSLLKDPLRRERLGQAARKVVVEHYAWESSARELDRLYRMYMGEPRQASVEALAHEGR